MSTYQVIIREREMEHRVEQKKEPPVKGIGHIVGQILLSTNIQMGWVSKESFPNRSMKQ